MSTELENPPTPSKLDPPSEGVKNMAARFMEARETGNPTPPAALTLKEEPTLVPKSAVDRILSPAKVADLAPSAAADPLAEFKDDKTAAANIPKMRALIGQNLEEIKKLKSEVEEARKSVAPAKEQEELRAKLDTLQKERDDLAQAVKIGNPEKSEEYQQMSKERGSLVDKLTTKLSDFGGDSDKLKDALSLSGKAKATALKEALSDLDVDDRTVLRLMVEDLEKLDEKRKDFLADADKTWSAKQQERTTKEREMLETKARELAGEIGKLKQTLPEEFFMLRTAEESPEWNESVNNAFAEAEAMAQGKRPREAVLKTLAMGLRAGHLAELFKAERGARVKAEEKLASRANAGPNIRGTTPANPSKGEHKSMGSRFASILANGGVQGD